MIVRPCKFDLVIISTIIICISFIFALYAENKAATTASYGEVTELPIIMYHHITESKEKTGKYTVHIEEFESDIKYISEQGYTTITVNDLIKYVNGEEALPQKPVMITFDDGFESFISLAFPVLKENNMKSVVSVIGSVSERYSENEDHNINYSNLNFNQIEELHNSGIVEIQNHSYDMHKSDYGNRKGISKLTGESANEYTQALTADLLTTQKILKLQCGITPQCVAYPFGAYSDKTLEIVKKLGFRCTLTCEERMNSIQKGNPDSLFNLGRYNRESGVSTKEFFNRFENQ